MVMEEMLDLIEKIELKVKLIERYTMEKEAMEKKLYALCHKLRNKNQLEIWERTWDCLIWAVNRQ